MPVHRIPPSQQDWLPQRINLNVDRLLLQGRELEAVKADFPRPKACGEGV